MACERGMATSRWHFVALGETAIACEEAGPCRRRALSADAARSSSEAASIVYFEEIAVVARHTFCELRNETVSTVASSDSSVVLTGGGEHKWTLLDENSDGDTASTVNLEDESSDSEQWSYETASSCSDCVAAASVAPSSVQYDAGFFVDTEQSECHGDFYGGAFDVAFVGVQEGCYGEWGHSAMVQCSNEIPSYWTDWSSRENGHRRRGTRKAKAPQRRSLTEIPESPTTFTTLLLKNIPQNCTSRSLAQILVAQGFEGAFTFVYVPANFQSWAAVGYAIVDWVSHEVAARAMAALQDFRGLGPEGLACCWNEPHQGLAVQIERYRNSPVAHESVLAQYKPLLFRGGVQRPFPKPTVPLKAPRLRPRPAIERSTSPQ